MDEATKGWNWRVEEHSWTRTATAVAATAQKRMAEAVMAKALQTAFFRAQYSILRMPSFLIGTPLRKQMILREMTEQDSAVIQNWPAYPIEFGDLDYALREAGWISEYLGKMGTNIYVAEECGVLIGFTILSRDDEEDGSSSAEFRIVLHPDFLGRGVGGKIAGMTIEKGFEELCLRRIYLIVRKRNLRAGKLYWHCGFRDTGECRKEVNGAVVDFLEMELLRESFKGWSRNDNDRD